MTPCVQSTDTGQTWPLCCWCIPAPLGRWSRRGRPRRAADTPDGEHGGVQGGSLIQLYAHLFLHVYSTLKKKCLDRATYRGRCCFVKGQVVRKQLCGCKAEEPQLPPWECVIVTSFLGSHIKRMSVNASTPAESWWKILEYYTTPGDSPMFWLIGACAECWTCYY